MSQSESGKLDWKYFKANLNIYYQIVMITN